MLNTFPLEDLLYQGRFAEVADGIEDLEELYPNNFYLSVFKSRYFEVIGDYHKAIALAESNWEKAKSSGKIEWKNIGRGPSS